MTKIIEIYKQYGIPQKLQDHMLRVAACGAIICQNWHGPSVSFEKLMRILLLHDMGNLVKVVEEYDEPGFLENRDKYRKLFGKDDHAVSAHIGKELGLTDEELWILQQKSFMNSENILNSDSYEIKIAAYCDQRVAPEGVTSLIERMLEGKERYKDRPGTSFNNPNTDKMIACMMKIEKQIIEYCSLPPEEICTETIAPYIKELSQFEI